jgi:hypothetical protein
LFNGGQSTPTQGTVAEIWRNMYNESICFTYIEHESDLEITHDENETNVKYILGRPQWSGGLRHVWSWTARTLGSWVRFSLEVCMSTYFRVVLSCVGRDFPIV